MTIAIFGAGSIGCYVGGRLQAGGANTLLFGRAAMGEVLARNGLMVSDRTGASDTVKAGDIQFSSEPAALARASLIIVCVKGKDTLSAGKTIAAHNAAAPVLSLQNGTDNPDRLKQHLPEWRVHAGMVPFNVVRLKPHHFHRGTDGAILCADHMDIAPFIAACGAAGLEVQTRADMQAVLWGKVLLNLNNGVNALSGLPLRAQLQERAYRRILAMTQREALSLMNSAGIKPAQVAKLPPKWLPRVLSLPTPLFRIAAAGLLKIDDKARSSMADDLAAGRAPEIDDLNGAVVRLGQSLGRDAPANRLMVEFITDSFAKGAPPKLSATALYRRFRAAV